MTELNRMSFSIQKAVLSLVILSYFTVWAQECPLPPAIPNGRVTAHGTTETSYECNSGFYAINGTDLLHCLNQTWVGLPLTCLQGCPIPPEVPFAFIAQYKDKGAIVLDLNNKFRGVKVNMEADYTCNPGYYMRGLRRSRLCQVDFTWTAIQFWCLKKSCSPPPMIDNGFVTGENFTLSSVLTWQCDPGYFSENGGRLPIQSTCIADTDGQVHWTQAPPVCKLICRPRDLNAIDMGRTCGTSCVNDADCPAPLKSCICDDFCGFSCINPDAVCPIPDQLVNGTTEYDAISYASSVNYSCHSGYVKVSGDSTRVCRSDLKWSGSVPVCIRGCGQPGPLSSGGIPQSDAHPVHNATGYLVGTAMEYKCQPGYGATGSSNVRVCQANFGWTTPQLSCVRGNCGPPSVPMNGHILQSDEVGGSNLLHGQSGIYNCDEGYVLNGTSNVTCSANSFGVQFYPLNPPICERGCTKPLLIDFGDTFAISNVVGTGFAIGFTATYFCDVGYYMDGLPTLTCTSNFNWTSHDFECKRMSCDVPLAPLNGSVIGTTLFGDKIEYSCDIGHIMVGDVNSTCVFNGSLVVWDSAAPVCQPVVCSPPEQPINGMVRSDREFTYGDIATYQCDFGYKPLENKPVQRRCNENGTWGETPICEVIYDCDFEEEATPTCGYENMGWFRRTVTDNGTVSFITGIAAFRDAVLVSQAYNGTGGCLSFNYRQSNNMVQAKSLQLVIMPAFERSPKTILWQSGTEPTDWTNQEVTIPASSSEVRWSFIYSGSSFSLLDDIVFDKSKVCDIEVVDPTSTLAVVETTTAPGAAASFSVSAFLTSLCLICCYYIAL